MSVSLSVGNLSHWMPPALASAPPTKPSASEEGKNQFFHGVDSGLRALAQWAANVTRSGTGLNLPRRLHQGISRKKPK